MIVSAAIGSTEPSSRRQRRAIVDFDGTPWPQRFPFSPLIRDELARPPRERHDGPGQVLVGLRDEWAAIGDEQILHVVGLAVAVEHGRLRVGAHADRAGFVDDEPAHRQPVVLLRGRHRGRRRAAHRLDDRS